MGKALDAIGLETKHLVLVLPVTMPVGSMRRSALVNVGRLPKDGEFKKEINCFALPVMN